MKYFKKSRELLKFTMLDFFLTDMVISSIRSYIPHFFSLTNSSMDSVSCRYDPYFLDADGSWKADQVKMHFL